MDRVRVLGLKLAQPGTLTWTLQRQYPSCSPSSGTHLPSSKATLGSPVTCSQGRVRVIDRSGLSIHRVRVIDTSRFRFQKRVPRARLEPVSRRVMEPVNLRVMGRRLEPVRVRVILRVMGRPVNRVNFGGGVRVRLTTFFERRSRDRTRVDGVCDLS